MDNVFLSMLWQQWSAAYNVMTHWTIVSVDLGSGALLEHYDLTAWDVCLTFAFWSIIVEAIRLCVRPIGSVEDD